MSKENYLPLLGPKQELFGTTVEAPEVHSSKPDDGNESVDNSPSRCSPDGPGRLQ